MARVMDASGAGYASFTDEGSTCLLCWTCYTLNRADVYCLVEHFLTFFEGIVSGSRRVVAIPDVKRRKKSTVPR